MLQSFPRDNLQGSVKKKNKDEGLSQSRYWLEAEDED